MGNIVEKCCEGSDQNASRSSRKVPVPADPSTTTNKTENGKNKNYDETFDKILPGKEEPISEEKIAKILDKKAKIKKKIEF